MALSIKDLKKVRGLLHPIRDKWYDIGLELDIDPDILDSIRDRCSDTKECLIERLKVWLGSCEAPPTWEALKEALQADPVGEMALAEQSRLHY